MKLNIRVLLIATSLIIGGNVNANENSSLSVVSKKAESAVCNKAEVNGATCKAFVLGFLRGALLTDAAIVDSFKSERLAIKDRAVKTRLGKRNQNVTARAGFCLPKDVELDIISNRVVEKLALLDRPAVAPAKSVYDILKDSYKCELK